nr:porin [uncultured Shimia sp.]
MKKVLFATTALVATAGVAAADVTFGGYGRFGIDYDEARAAGSETRIESRFRLVVTASAESDNGLSFGAQIRYQSNEAATGYGASAAGFNMPRFWVSTGGLTVSVGNTLGALENMPGMYAGSLGLTGLGYANVVYNFLGDAYTSGAGGRQGLDVIYAAGNWGVHLSYSPDAASQGGVGTLERTALAVSYTMGNYTFALAGQDSNSAADTEFAFTAGGSWGNLDATLQYADNGTGGSKYGIGGQYQVGSATFIRAYINHDEALAGGTGDENMGIGFQHRFGGGTFLEGGVADLAGRTRADLGLRFSF